MPLARSFLYVPANREKFLEKAIGLPSDAFIFDLEDSVPVAEKAVARAGVREYAPKIAGDRIWVRVNGLETGFAADDLDAVIGVAGLAGIFLPKVETPDEVHRWDAMIGALETERGLTPGAIKVVISIESALGVLNAYAMATAAARIVSLTFGGAQDGDLNTDLGCAWSIDGPEMLHARAHTLLAARAARFDTPLDGVFADVRDAEGFARDTALSRRLGYRGRKLIHPVADRAVQPALPPERGRARLLRARAGGVRPGGGARQRLDHRRRPHDRPRHGQRGAAGSRRGGGVEEGGVERSNERAADSVGSPLGGRGRNLERESPLLLAATPTRSLRSPPSPQGGGQRAAARGAGLCAVAADRARDVKSSSPRRTGRCPPRTARSPCPGRTRR